MIGREDNNVCDEEEINPIKTNRMVNQHKKNTKKFLRRLYFNVCISSLFMIGEIVGGTISGSIAILTDAFHIFTDILGFLIAIISLHITQKPPSHKMSYGFYRAEVIGALLSIALIWGLTIWLVTEAIKRFITPEEVNGLIMLITALGGLAGNVLMGVVLIGTDPEAKDDVPAESTQSIEKENSPEDVKKPKTEKSLNMRAAIIHVLGDTLQSVGVSIAGGIIYAKHEYMVADPICTLLFCIVVFATTVPILKDCVNILMEGAPSNQNIEDISIELGKIEDVSDVHDLHVWCLSAGKIALSCHVVTDSPDLALDKVTILLKEKYNIGHLTIQTENSNSEKGFVCANDLH